jgi:hypothetical protein
VHLSWEKNVSSDLWWWWNRDKWWSLRLINHFAFFILMTSSYTIELHPQHRQYCLLHRPFEENEDWRDQNDSHPDSASFLQSITPSDFLCVCSPQINVAYLIKRSLPRRQVFCLSLFTFASNFWRLSWLKYKNHHVNLLSQKTTDDVEEVELVKCFPI